MTYKLIMETETTIATVKTMESYNSIGECFYQYELRKVNFEYNEIPTRLTVKALKDDHTTEILACHTNEAYIDMYL